MRNRLPMTAREAVAAGFYDACLPDPGFARRCRAAGGAELAAAPDFPPRLAGQARARRQADEARKPLAAIAPRNSPRCAAISTASIRATMSPAIISCAHAELVDAASPARHRDLDWKRATMTASPPRLPAVLVIDDECVRRRRCGARWTRISRCSPPPVPPQGMEILENEQSTGAIRIVLCDQRMPGMTGVEFLKQVRDRWPDVMRIILSGYTDAEDIIAGVNEAGIWQYLLKPWQPEQLLLTLQRARRSGACSRKTSACRSRCAPPSRSCGSASRAKKGAPTRASGWPADPRGPGSPLNAVCD
jgi:CheY-like chemotaxis protein